MVRTRLVPRRNPNPNVNLNTPGRDVDFQTKRVATTKELGRRIRASDVKIKFLLPRVKDIEVKKNRVVVRKMKVRRVAKHAAKKRNVRYG